MIDLSNSRILVVDDIEPNVEILVDMLEDDYMVDVAMDGTAALKQVESKPPDLILLDIMMPGINGYEVCRRLKSDTKTAGIPVIFLTALSDEADEAKGLALGAVDYIIKPFNRELVKARVRNHLDLKNHRDHLEKLVKERTVELEKTQEVTIEALSVLAEYRDPETGGHIKRTQNYVKVLAEKVKHHPSYNHYLNDQTIDLLYQSAPLHDVGKVGIPDNILLKPDKLTTKEFEVMKRHTIIGRETIRRAEEKLGDESFLTYAREIAEFHQEKWDGTGYPHGLKGEEIPISGRIMALADVYDALISKRVYKPPFPHKKAVEIILEGKGNHFDPLLVDAFVELQEQFREIALKYADFEDEIEALSQKE